MAEKWKDINGFPGYMVSNKGRVKSLRKKIVQRNGHPMTFPEKILKQTSNEQGYLYVTLCKDHKHKAMKVHRLVLLTFEKRVIGKDAVHHKDHNRKNNELSNLMWVTPKENASFNQYQRYQGYQIRDERGRFKCKI